MAFLVDSLLSESITKLTELVMHVANTTGNQKPELKLLGVTLERITPIIPDIVSINRKLGLTEEECKIFINEIKQAEKIIYKYSKVKMNFMKKFVYSQMLKQFNEKLLLFFQIQTRGIANYSGSGVENMEREKYGWVVPVCPSGIVAFDEPLAKLKAEIVAGIDRGDDGNSLDCDDRSVLVVAAAGGCGKTTLVKMLCHDPEIREKFGENIFFVTVSETPNFMVIVNDLFNPNSSALQVLIHSNKDAKNKLEHFLNQKISGPMLLVLDDVWSDSFIDNFPSKNRGCIILVTSRVAFLDYDVFPLDSLNEEDAKTLLCRSAFNEAGRRPSPSINDKLVNQEIHSPHNGATCKSLT